MRYYPLLLLLLCIPAAAQPRSEIIDFQAAAEAQTTLFRGEQAEWYGFPANGTPYWSSPSFFTGSIEVRGRVYYDVTMNVDAVAHRALVQVPGSPMAVSLLPASVSRIDSDKFHFVGFGPDGPLAEGFYQVMGTGPEKVYKSVHKYLSSSTDNVNGAGIGYDDLNYRRDITRYFAIRTQYYFLDAQGVFHKIRSKNSLLARFGERKKALKKAVRETSIDKLPFDRYCEEVLKLAGR